MAVVAVMCSSCGSCQRPAASPASTSSTTTAATGAPTTAQAPAGATLDESVNQQLRRQLQDKPDPVLAAQLFSIEVTPLPGASIPAGRRESPMSGTYAGIQLLAVFDNRAIPRPIYTDPEIAAVGLTEAEAREQYGDDVAVGVFPWVANARAVMQDSTIGWVKSIHETRYGELLGIVMVGPHVTDLIEAGVVALDAEATVETVADGIAAHPTLSEAIKEAGLMALGRPIHMPPKRKAAAKA
jgi:hypothetical protein